MNYVKFSNEESVKSFIKDLIDSKVSLESGDYLGKSIKYEVDVNLNEIVEDLPHDYLEFIEVCSVDHIVLYVDSESYSIDLHLVSNFSSLNYLIVLPNF